MTPGLGHQSSIQICALNNIGGLKHTHIAAEVSLATILFRHLSDVASKTNQPVNKETL